MEEKLKENKKEKTWSCNLKLILGNSNFDYDRNLMSIISVILTLALSEAIQERTFYSFYSLI